jgi:WXG100 family type VII secretion target
MASGIAVTPDKLREISGQMSSGAADVEAIVSRLSGDVAPVRSEWAGPAQSLFNALWDQLQKDAGGVNSVLNGIAELTQKAAAAYEATEQSIAKSFDAFRIERDVNAAIAGVLGEGEMEEISERFNQIEEALAETSGETKVVEIEVVEPEVVDFDIVDSEIVEINDVTEVEDDLVEVPDESEDRPAKASSRLPWARFMTKSAQSDGGQFTTGPRHHERRFKLTDPALKPGTRLCRLCFTVIVIEPEYIEASETLVYLSCPHCERSFPIRRSDV